MATSLIKLISRRLLSHKVSRSKIAANPALWFLPQNYYSCIINYFDSASTALTSRKKEFLTLVQVFGLWQLITLKWNVMVTKYPLGLFSQILAVEDGKMSQIGIFISQLWYIYLNGVVQNKNMLWNLILCIPATRKMSPSHWKKLSCLPAPLLSDIRNSKFYIPFILMYYQKTRIWSLKGGQRYKKISPDHKVGPWKYQVVLEIVRWCWKVKNIMLHHSKIGRGEPCSRYIFSKIVLWDFFLILRWCDY